MKNYFNWLFYVAVTILIFILFYLNIPNYVDDAYITLKYARNFLEGNGLVWNIGEYVQGYTNFLHLILISLFGYIFNDLYLSSYIVNFISYFALVFLLFKHRYMRELANQSLILITIISSSPIIVWTLGGMETVLFTFFILYSFFELESKKDNKLNYFYSGLLINLAMLTRPDAAIFAFIYFVIILFNHKNIKGLIYYISTFVILFCYILWTYNYYGDILPNTYYVKSYGIGNFKYEFGFYYLFFIIKRPMFLIPIYLFLKLFYKKYEFTKYDAIILIFLSYIVNVGGDHMTAFRFYAPVIPFLTLAIFSLINQAKKINDILLKCIILILITSQIFYSSLTPRSRDKVTKVGKEVGIFINYNFEKNSLIALNTAGTLPYFAKDFKYIDMLGLNDKVISRRRIDTLTTIMQKYPGHSKGDGSYVLGRKPDYIIFGSSEGTKDSILFLSDYEIYHSKEFKENYEFHKALIQSERDTFYFQYYKRIKK